MEILDVTNDEIHARVHGEKKQGQNFSYAS